MTEALTYALSTYVVIAYVVVVGTLLGYYIGRRRGVNDAMAAARAAFAKIQGERLQRSKKQLTEAVDRLKLDCSDEVCPNCGADSAEVVFAPIYKWKDDMSGLSGEIQCIGCGQTFTPRKDPT